MKFEKEKEKEIALEMIRRNGSYSNLVKLRKKSPYKMMEFQTWKKGQNSEFKKASAQNNVYLRYDHEV